MLPASPRPSAATCRRLQEVSGSAIWNCSNFSCGAPPLMTATSPPRTIRQVLAATGRRCWQPTAPRRRLPCCWPMRNRSPRPCSSSVHSMAGSLVGRHRLPRRPGRPGDSNPRRTAERETGEELASISPPPITSAASTTVRRHPADPGVMLRLLRPRRRGEGEPRGGRQLLDFLSTACSTQAATAWNNSVIAGA